MIGLLDYFVPATDAILMRARARALVATCLALGLAILGPLLYWIAFNCIEQIETVFTGLG